MSDNKQLIFDRIDQDIDPNGAEGSILAINHNEIAKLILDQAGKYIGSYFVAQKVTSTFTPGVFSWENNSLNNTSSFTIKTAKQTADLLDFGEVLKNITPGSILKFKDYAGRTAYYEFESYSLDETTPSNAFYEITIKGLAGNPNYTYQDSETRAAGIEFFIKQVSGLVIVNGNPFNLRKHINNNDPEKLNVIELNDMIYEGWWDNDTYWGRAMYTALGTGIDDIASWNVLDEWDELTIL